METIQSDAPLSTVYLIEDYRRLSDSRLWYLQRRYFSEQGIDAWRNSIVPHYVTSNTFIARAYARLVFGYVRDLVSDTYIPIDTNQPLYIVELGAGSGRFSYHFLKSFFSIWQESTLNHIPIKYVMSDLCEANIVFWQQHSFLQSYIEQGLLDFALVDVGKTQDIILQNSGEIISSAQLKNPLIAIANYLFDSIEQDAFYFNDGTLYESLVSLYDNEMKGDLNDKTILQRVHTQWLNVPAQSDYYPEPEFNQILAYYQQHLVDSHVLLPVQAIRYIAHLRHISNNRLLLISGDKGFNSKDDLLFCPAPRLVSHGSISLSVNYHAIGHYIAQAGGVLMATPQRHQGLHICAAVFGVRSFDLVGEKTGHYLETRQAFTEHISQMGPDDFYSLKRFIQGNADALELEQLLAYIRFSGWDTANFWGCYTAFMKHAETAKGPLKQELGCMVGQVWNSYYPLGEDRDLAFALGSLLYEIEHYPEAIIYLEHSRTLYGDEASTLYNLGMCYYNLRQLPQALHWVNMTLQLDPVYEPAHIMHNVIESEMC